MALTLQTAQKDSVPRPEPPVHLLLDLNNI